MAYQPIEVIRNDHESDHNYVARIIQDNPKGYAPIIRRLPLTEVIDICRGNTFGEKLYNWLNPNARYNCLHCNQPSNFKQLSHGYYEYCSYTCRAQSKQSFKNGTTDHAKEMRRLSYQTNKDAIVSKQCATKISRYGTAGNVDAKQSGYRAKVARYGERVVETLSSADQLTKLIVNDLLTAQAIGDMLGVSSDVVLSHARKAGVKFPKVRGESKQEIQLRLWIESLGVDVKSRDTSIGIEIDMLIGNIGIEYNGSYWHSPDNKLTRITPKTHYDKTVKSREHGVQLIHIFDTEWINTKQIVQNRIINKLGLGNKLFARKLMIREVSYRDAKAFFQSNHIQGSCPSKISYGMFDRDRLVSCMSFGKPRYNNNYQWEILRYSNEGSTSVVGGASRLFKHFIKTHHPESVISYCDMRWGTGKMYQSIGMSYDGETPPSYWLVNPKDPLKTMYHRSHFMKHKLIEQGYSADKTEHQITQEIGLFRVYDCGTTRWVWNQPEKDNT